MTYCYRCGDKLEVKEDGKSWHSPGCGLVIYANPISTVDAALFDEQGRVLLGIRNEEPNKGKLNLPGGFVDMGETIEEALARELQEELKIYPNDYGKLSYAGNRIDWYEINGENRQLLSFMFAGRIKYREFELSDEVSGYVWKLPDELKPDEVTNEREYNHILRTAKVLGS